MATNKPDPFARLDELVLSNSSIDAHRSFSGPSNWSADGTIALGEAKAISANTSDKAYRKLTSHENVTSYSLLSKLHECPRKYELDKLQANHPSSETPEEFVNLDFAYGHAVGAGIQTYAATGDVTAAIFAAMLAWKAPWDAEKLDKRENPTGKSLTMATLAVEKFAYWWERNLADWEVVVLPSGKKAVELAFAIDFQNGRYHFGHIDVMLQNRTTGTLAVWEGKTTGFEHIDEALYANSNQALGYSVVVDAIAKEIGASGTEYEVLYIVYSSKTRDFQLLPFGKSRSQRAEWLQDTLLDHASLDTYKRIKFYPKRGENCLNRYGFRCNWFGTCTMRNESLFPGLVLPELASERVRDGIESLDFVFRLDDLVAAQVGEE
jgi:hypothetical protein